ncbi:MAG: glycoside hydrolase family 108 protein [Beijerinckiaceae bacterium]|nr:glycoside hydrolase family 108 protein [Beijerinckiaceae bacterium]MCZ8298644.1 glycoside hydrolase family 108 protein [Beijerinckiaceae bacterium]
MARTTFEPALAFVLRHEGGFADHPADPGGATNLGITLATLSAWRGRAATVADLRALTLDEAAAIYRARYWDAVAGDALPAGLDLVIFDAAVNSGPARAARWLQALLAVPADGVIGPVTLAAAREAGTAGLIASFTARRQAFVESLPAFRTFGRGWSRRIAAARVAGLALVVPEPSTPSPSGKETLMKTESHKNMESPMQMENPATSADPVKPAYASRTLWANAIGLAALLLSWWGITIPGLDTVVLQDSLLQGIAGFGFVASSLFRLVATRRLMP